MKVSWLQNSSLGQDYLKIWLSSTQTVFQPNKNYWSFHWISRLCNTNLAWLKVCFFLKMMYFITACKHSPLSWEFQFCFAKSLRMVVEQGISWKPDRVPRIFQYCILFPPLPGRFIVLQKCSLASQVFSLCCNQEVSYTHIWIKVYLILTRVRVVKLTYAALMLCQPQLCCEFTSEQ